MTAVLVVLAAVWAASVALVWACCVVASRADDDADSQAHINATLRLVERDADRPMDQ